MKCVLGFDGGGTKTECVAIDLSGHLTARGRGPASNPTRIGFDAAAMGVKQAADATLATVKKPIQVLAVCAGLAGTAQRENHDRMQQLLEQKFPGIPVHVFTDLDLALEAMPDGPAIALVAGTGSAAVGRDSSGRQLREGGFGPNGSDEGSAFDVGRSAVRVAREGVGDGAAELSRQILRHLGCDDWAAVDARASLAADDVYPRVFPVVAASADAGNPLAQSILNDAAQKLTAITARLAESLGIAGQTFSLGKSGGTVGRSHFFDQALDGQLRKRFPNATISRITAEAAETAARLVLSEVTSREEAAR